MHGQQPSGKTAASPQRIPQRQRLSLPGHAYLLTATTLFRRPVFRDDLACRAVASAHRTRWLWRDSQLLAWVLMPDHWHALIVLGRSDTLATLMGRFKSATARAVDDRHRINGWLWSRGFHDRALGDDEDLQATARHLVANPLRARLVSHLGQYPYWDAVWLDPEHLSAPARRLGAEAFPAHGIGEDSIRLDWRQRGFIGPMYPA